MSQSPLLDLHEGTGARFTQVDGWRIPQVYSSVDEEYSAATEGVGLTDRSHMGRLRFNGTDALDLLNRLSTNNLDDLAVGQGMHTVLTSNKGRILDVPLVLRLADHLLVLTSPENRRKVAEHIDLFTFSEDVAVEDMTEDSVMLSLVGPKASEVLSAVVGQQVVDFVVGDSTDVAISGEEALVIRSDFVGILAYDLVVSASRASKVWGALLESGAGLGIRPVGAQPLEVVRVEQGMPAYGKDMSEANNPLEAGLIEYISFDKGCYVGQEVVARLNTYDKVQKRLVGLTFDGEHEPAAGTKLFDNEKQVGTITSFVRSSRLKKGLGLGYVRKAFAEPGVRLDVGSTNGPQVAQVAGLPFRP